MKVFHVRLDGGHLVPVTAVDAEELDKLKGQVLEVSPKPVDEQRNKLLRRIFLLCSKFLEHADDPPWEDVAEVVDAVKLRAGLVIPSNDLDGKFYRRLVTSRDMNRDQIKHLHDETVKHLSATLGFNVETLLPPRTDASGKPAAKAAPGEAAAAKPAAGREEPAAGAKFTPADFLRQMLAVVKRDPEVDKADKARILRNAAPMWHETLGPGYVGMVNAVINALADAMAGKMPLEDAIRYADTHVRYWNPDPPKKGTTTDDSLPLV